MPQWVRIPGAQGVSQPDPDRVDSQFACQPVHLVFHGEVGLELAEAAKSAGDAIVRVHTVAVHYDGRYSIHAGTSFQGQVGHRPAQRCIRPGVRHQAHLVREERPVAPRPGLHVDGHWMAFPAGDRRLLSREHYLHRAAGRQGAHGQQDLECDLVLAPKRASRRTRDHSNPGRLDSERPGNLHLIAVWVLSSAVYRDVAFRTRYSHSLLRLHEGMHLPRQLVKAFHDQVGLGKPLLYIAVLHMSLHVHIARFMHSRRIGQNSRLRIVHDGQDLIVHIYKRQGPLSLFGALRYHQSHRVAHVPDLVAAQYRLVGDGYSVAVEPSHVAPSEHFHHSRRALGPGCIDRSDVGVWMLASEHAPVGHPGELQIAHVLLLAGDLAARIHPRYRPTYPFEVMHGASLTIPRQRDASTRSRPRRTESCRRTRGDG